MMTIRKAPTMRNVRNGSTFERMTDNSEKKNSAFVPPHPLEALALLAQFAALLLYVVSILGVYGIPYGVDFGEGYLADMSLRLVSGANPYHSLENAPWIVSSYPPLYPLLNGLITAIVGPSLLPGRFIATASFIGILAVTVLVMRKMRVSTTIAVMTAGLLLVLPWGVRWSQVVRVDTLGILLSLGGLYWWIRSSRRSDAVVAAILLAGAVLTKHSLLAAPLACLVHGFLTRDSRRMILLALLLVLIGGSYGLINLLTGGGLFLHLFTYTANAWFLPRFIGGVGMYFKPTWSLHVIAIAALLIPGTVSGTRRIIGWYCLLAHLALFAYGFEGSDTNYLIEPLLTASLLAGLTLDRMTAAPETAKPMMKGLPSARTIGFALVLLICILGRFIDQSEYRIHRINPERLRNGLELIRLCRSTPCDVLSEDASFTFLAGKPVLFQPYIMSLLARTGKWDQSEFVASIRDGAYSIIVLRVDLNDPYNTEQAGGAYEMAGFDRWTDEMEEAILERYYLYGPLDVGVGNYWYVYILKNPPAPEDS